MTTYAHVPISFGKKRYEPGDVLPDSLPGLAELVEYGSASLQPFSRVYRHDADGNAIAEVHPDGIEVPVASVVHRWNANLTHEEIADPAVDTDVHYDGFHLGREPDISDDGQVIE